MNDLESNELIVVWFNGHTEVQAGIPGMVRSWEGGGGGGGGKEKVCIGRNVEKRKDGKRELKEDRK